MAGAAARPRRAARPERRAGPVRRPAGWLRRPARATGPAAALRAAAVRVVRGDGPARRAAVRLAAPTAAAPGYEETVARGVQQPAWQEQPPQQPPSGSRARRRRRHRGRRWLIALIVLILVLVAADFGAKAFAENAIASKIDSSGLGTKPSVDIEGFPFLTQVASRDLKPDRHQREQLHGQAGRDQQPARHRDRGARPTRRSTARRSTRSTAPWWSRSPRSPT